MKKVICLLFVFFGIQVNAQQQYIAYFTPPSDFSDWSIYKQGYINNFSTPTSFDFDNVHQFGGQYIYYSKSIYDVAAQNYAQNYDSIIYKFKYKTLGYAKNFIVSFDWLVGSGVPLLYNVTKSYNNIDSASVRLKSVGFYTNYPANSRVSFVKTDTTTNFSVIISDLDIKGYLHYSITDGVTSYNKSESKITWNNEFIYFNEKLLNKKYWITDLYGRIIQSGITNSLQEKLNLENGLYILNTEQSSQKMIISK